MQPHQFNINTGAISDEKLVPDAHPAPGVKLLLVPVVVCLDCPGMCYVAKPGTLVDDLSTHMRNKVHIQSQRLRLWVESHLMNQEPRLLYNAIKERNTFRSKALLFSTAVCTQMWLPFAIHIIKFGTVEILEVFCLDRVGLHSLDKTGRNALHYACYLGKAGMALYLTAAGLDQFSKDSSGVSPVELAMKQGHMELATWLVKLSYHNDSTLGRTSLGRACILGSLTMVTRLLEAGEDPDGLDPWNAWNGSHLDTALQYSSPAIVDALLDFGASGTCQTPSFTQSLKSRHRLKAVFGPGQSLLIRSREIRNSRQESLHVRGP